MNHDLLFEAEAKADLGALDKEVARRILAKLEQLRANPLGFNSTALVGESQSRRLRIGAYRVIYLIEDAPAAIVVTRIGHRRDIYDR